MRRKSRGIRAAELCKELVDYCTDTCAKQSGRSGHSVTNYCGYSNGCSQNCQYLLECEDEKLGELWLVFNAINQIHTFTSKILNFTISIISLPRCDSKVKIGLFVDISQLLSKSYTMIEKIKMQW